MKTPYAVPATLPDTFGEYMNAEVSRTTKVSVTFEATPDAKHSDILESIQNNYPNATRMENTPLVVNIVSTTRTKSRKIF